MAKLLKRETIFQATGEGLVGTVEVVLVRETPVRYELVQNGAIVDTEHLRWSWQFHQREIITRAEKMTGNLVTGRPNCGPTYQAQGRLAVEADARRWAGSAIDPAR